MNYRSVNDLNEAILQWIPRLPRDFELIVGIPRSGLLAANLFALHLNLPLTDLEGFIQGRVFRAGERCRLSDRQKFLDQPRNVLLMDDSVLLGMQMKMARTLVQQLEGRHQIRYAAVYLQPGMERHVDFFCELLPRPRLFEWHLMHHGNLRHWCVDIDGVLCADPEPADNDDGENYLRWLHGVPPKIVPTKEIGWLVTCRLEKYRSATENWLRRYGIRFRHLVMMDYPDMARRREAGDYAPFKAEIYKETGAPLFIESSLQQAVEICSLSGKDVFCFETREMIHPGILPRVLHQPGNTLNQALNSPKLEIRRLLHQFLKS